MDKRTEDAIKLHQSGKIAEAASSYHSIIEDNPDNAEALHFYGLLLYQGGQHEQGMALISRALDVEPMYSGACNNLANMKIKMYSLEEARVLYEKAVELDPNAFEPLFNLGVLARARQEYEVAENMFHRAMQIDPNNTQTLFALTNLYIKLDLFEPAQEILDRAVGSRLDPADEITALQTMARLAQLLDKPDEALKIYKQLVEKHPEDAAARHMVLALSDEQAPDMPDEVFVKQLFDRFSNNFDEVLDNLDYRAPLYIQALVERYYPEEAANLNIVDAGCGTGLCGHYLKPRASSLVGVDLSPGMLSRAKDRMEYDQLIEADLNVFFTDSTDNYDLIVCADTLCYFGELATFFSACRARMNGDSWLFFTVEKTDGDTDQGFILHSHGRYSHSIEYVYETLAQSGLEAEVFEEQPLRMERGEPVAGYIVAARPNIEH